MFSLVLNLKLHLCFLWLFFFSPSPSLLYLANTYHKSAVKLTSLYQEHESGDKHTLDCQLEWQVVSSLVSIFCLLLSLDSNSSLETSAEKGTSSDGTWTRRIYEAEEKTAETKQDPTQPKLWLSETKQDTTGALSPLYLRFVLSLFSSVSRVSDPRKEREWETLDLLKHRENTIPQNDFWKKRRSENCWRREVRSGESEREIYIGEDKKWNLSRERSFFFCDFFFVKTKFCIFK